MEIEIQITSQPIQAQPHLPVGLEGQAGAVTEFAGVVRDEEEGQPIAALEYEAYRPMAEQIMRQIVVDIASRQPCLWVRIIHRIGVVPAGETAIAVTVAARHRAAAFAMLAEFMDRLKQDVPIWKRRALGRLDAPAPAKP